MAKPKVTVRFDSLKNIAGGLDKRLLREIGATIVDEVLANTSRGISSVKGEPAKFESYAVDRTGNKNGYPTKSLQKKYGKKKKPVNLTLKGGYLEKISYDITRGTVYIYLKDFKGKIKDLFEAHNLGLNKKNNVPKRKHLPSEIGDRFTIRIEQKILEFFRKAVEDAIKKGNK